MQFYAKKPIYAPNSWSSRVNSWATSSNFCSAVLASAVLCPRKAAKGAKILARDSMLMRGCFMRKFQSSLG